MNSELEQNGYLVIDFPFASELKPFVIEENFLKLDQFLLKEFLPTGRFFHFFAQFHTMQKMDHIIALRSSPDDEDGIWHDDGSRYFGFSLSLNLHPEQISGGKLLFKRKNSSEILEFPPQPFGRLIIFLTGRYGYDHKVCQVTNGKRLVIAGWAFDESWAN